MRVRRFKTGWGITAIEFVASSWKKEFWDRRKYKTAALGWETLTALGRRTWCAGQLDGHSSLELQGGGEVLGLHEDPMF